MKKYKSRLKFFNFLKFLKLLTFQILRTRMNLTILRSLLSDVLFRPK